MEFTQNTIDLKKKEETTALVEAKTKAVPAERIETLLAPVNTGDLSTITKFGDGVAEELANASKVVIQGASNSNSRVVGDLMKDLTRIMKRFDLEEITEDEPKSFVGKLFKGGRASLDKLVAKYTSVGKDIENIHIQLKELEANNERSTSELEAMYNQCVGYYYQLAEYIAAGKEGVKRIDARVAELRKNLDGGDSSATFEITSLTNARNLFDSKVMDLEAAQTTALQTIPMLNIQGYTNAMLNRKINSAFIVTLPAFTSALAQAVTAKSQKLQAESLAALDKATNDLYKRNAKSVVETAKQATQLAAGPSVTVDTLKETWATIVDGAKEVAELTKTMAEQNESDRVALSELQDRYWVAATNGELM